MAARPASVQGHFYPRPPRGGRPAKFTISFSAKLFLSTPSARRATSTTAALQDSGDYFYPRPPRGGRQRLALRRLLFLEISIHALREEGDAQMIRRVRGESSFLSTPSARRATLLAGPPSPYKKKFLSTPSARRATKDGALWAAENNISIHALREEGDVSRPRRRSRGNISIHALREEGDRRQG